MNTDGAIAAVKLLERVAVGCQRQDPRTQESAGRRGPSTNDREQSPWRRCTWLADHHLYAPHQAPGTICGEGACRGGYHQSPWRRPKDHPVGANPSAGVIGPPRKPYPYPAPAATSSGRAQHQQPRRLPRSDRGRGLRTWGREAAEHGGRSEQLSAPCNRAGGPSNSRIRGVASVTAKRRSGRRHQDQPHPDRREPAGPTCSANSCAASRHCDRANCSTADVRQPGMQGMRRLPDRRFGPQCPIS